MTGLAWRSLSGRRTAFLATACSLWLGATVILAFLTLLETGLGAGVSAFDEETLVVMASVVGGWAVVIVVFSVASMLALTVRRRSEEFALLRTVGATRRQVRRLVLAESLAVAVAASALAVVPGWLLGRAVLGLIQRSDMVSDGVEHRGGWLALGATFGAIVLASVLAALLAARVATRGSAQTGLLDSRTVPTRLGRRRIAGGLLLLAAGANYSALTVTVMADSADPYAAMSAAGPASVFWSIGLAVFAPVLLRVTATVLAPLVRSISVGIPAQLALAHTRRRAHELSGVLMPVLILVGMGTGTLYLMQIENRTAGTLDVTGANLALVNYLVVGMIAAFAAIMVVNGTLAAITDRRREFAQQRLAGVTRAEVGATVVVESLVLLATALLFGGLASLGTIIPYSVVKTDGWLSVDGPGWYLAVGAVAVVVTIGTAVAATRRVIAGPAVRPQLG